MAAPNIPPMAFRVLNVIVGILVALAGLIALFSWPQGFQRVIINLYTILFGVIVVMLEFYTPDAISKHCSFMFNFFGRGLAFLFLGCLILDGYGFWLVAGIIVLIAAFFYIVLFFAANIQPPAAGGYMRREATAPAPGAATHA